MSNQKLNAINIPGIQELEDYQAELVSAGRFTYDTGAEAGVSESRSLGDISLSGATKLDLRNADSNRDDRNADGHTFSVTFVDDEGDEIGSTGVRYGQGITSEYVQQCIAQGATMIDIGQA